MKYLRLLILAFPFMFLSFQSAQTETENNNAGKWISLFNGKDIDNWIPKIVGHKLGENFGSTFRVENGILSVRYDAYDSFKNRFGALYYNKKFIYYNIILFGVRL